MLQTVIEKITPTAAQKYLELNTVNRPVRLSHVDFLAREIKHDRWSLNGSSIVFNEDKLVDGQHRLMAVVKVNKPITSVVVRGADDNSFATIDTGKPRSAGDVLSIVGEKNANHLGAAARFVMAMSDGTVLGKPKYSNSVLVDFIEKNPELSDSVTYVLSCHGQKIFSKSLASSLHFLMAKKDKELADLLFSGIYRGFDNADEDTFLALRERLISGATATDHSRPRPLILAIYVIKAWNARRMGSRLRLFKFSSGELFPRIK